MSEGAPNESIIEQAQVPELEIVFLQQQLNARIRAGQLSGPLLAESGKLDDKTRDKQREMEAFDAIALAKIEPGRPTGDAAAAAARAEDERVLAFVREELKFIGDTPYMDQDHKAPTIDRIRKLEVAFRRKWEASGRAAEAIEAALREPVRPGSLLLSDGSFAYDKLQYALEQLRKAEHALVTVPEGDPDRPPLEEKVVAFRVSVVEGLRAGPGRRPATTPLPGGEAPAPPPVASPSRPLPPPPPRPEPAAAPAPPPPPEAPKGWLADPEREKEGRRLDMLGPEERAKDAAAREPGDPAAARLAASVARTHPEAFTATLAERLDPYAMQELARDPEKLAKVPPKARLAIIKAFTAREGADAGAAEAEAGFAGAIAAGLLRQHPNAAGEILLNTPGPLKKEVSVAMLGRMSDDEVARLPREALHVLYKEIQAGGTADDRRHMARLVRLMNKR